MFFILRFVRRIWQLFKPLHNKRIHIWFQISFTPNVLLDLVNFFIINIPRKYSNNPKKNALTKRCDFLLWKVIHISGYIVCRKIIENLF